MKRIVLIGASGHGKVCGEIAEQNAYDEVLFLDDDSSRNICGRYPVVGKSADYSFFGERDTDFFVSIGNPDIRRRLQEKLISEGANLAVLIHPNSVVGKDVRIAEGCVVLPGAVINSGTSIGRGVIINTSSSVDHDCVIGGYSHVAVGAHICGTVNIGENCWIGAGATISNNIEICGNCIIGVGAVVINDITKPGTYVGIPASWVKSNGADINVYNQ